MNPTKSRQTSRGSAFLMALLVVAILTVIGLSLVLVTETEMLLGSGEKSVNEVFYASEAGPATLEAQLLATNSNREIVLLTDAEVLEDVRTFDNGQLGFRIRSTGIAVAKSADLPYSNANDGEAKFKLIYFFGDVMTERGWDLTARGDCASPSDREFTEVGFLSAPLEDLPGEDLNQTVQSSSNQFHSANSLLCEDEVDSYLTDPSDVNSSGGGQGYLRGLLTEAKYGDYSS